MKYQEKNPDIIAAIQIANSGNLELAEKKLNGLLINNRQNNFLLINLATLYFFKNKFDQVVHFLDQFLDSAEDQYEEFYFNATSLYSQCGKYSKAVDCAQQLTQYFPHNIQGKVLLANSCFEGRNTPLAKQTAEKVLSIDPNHIEMLLFLAKVALGEGEFQSATNYYNKVFSLDPSNPYACAGMSKCIKFTQQDSAEYLQKFQNALSSKHNINNEAAIYFAIAKIHNDIGDYSKAWKMAEKANKLQTERIPFDIKQYESYIDQLIGEYKKLNFNEVVSESDDRPILIIGMPRSGTTLTEQILSLDENLYPGGEMKGIDYSVVNTFGQMDFLQVVQQLNPNKAKEMASSYTEYYRQFCNFHGNRVIDKVPSNYLYIGIFKAMFPNIKIINLWRNPFDILVSIFFENFNAKFNYTNKIEDIICVLKQYQKLMAFWNEVMPESILNLNYEDLVNHHQDSKETIIQFCNLGISTEKDYKVSENIVNTPSSWQVRQGIYNTSIQRWLRYEPFLTPFKNILDNIDEAKKTNH